MKSYGVTHTRRVIYFLSLLFYKTSCPEKVRAAIHGKINRPRKYIYTYPSGKIYIGIKRRRYINIYC